MLGMLLLGGVFCVDKQIRKPPDKVRESRSVAEKRQSGDALPAADGGKSMTDSVERWVSERRVGEQSGVEVRGGVEGGHLPETVREGKGIWSAYRVIDIHAHIGSFRGFDIGTATLLDNVRRYGIELALISNIDAAHLPGVTGDLNEVQANRETARVVQQYPHLFRGVAWARPLDGSPTKIKPFLEMKMAGKSPKRIFVAIKLHPEMNQFNADDSRVDGYMKLCKQFGIPAVFHSGSAGQRSDPARIYTLARRHPSVAVVLYHMGFGGGSDHAIAVVKKSIQQKNARLYLGTAQALPTVVLKAVRALGADRVLLGTDATYYGRDHYASYAGLMLRLKKDLSARDFNKVVRENAKQLFGL